MLHCGRLVTTLTCRECETVTAMECNLLYSLADLRQGYPLNLNILLSGGKETNKDGLSNGE